MASSDRLTQRSVVAILAQLGGALLGGLLGAILGFALSSLLFANAGLGMGLLVVQVYSVILGFGVGAALGGRAVGQAGHVWLAMIASVIAGVVVAAVPRLTFVRIDLLTIPVVAAVVSIAAAAAAYNIRWQSQKH